MKTALELSGRMLLGYAKLRRYASKLDSLARRQALDSTYKPDLAVLKKLGLQQLEALAEIEDAREQLRTIEVPTSGDGHIPGSG